MGISAVDVGRVVFIDVNSLDVADPVLDVASLLASLQVTCHLFPVSSTTPGEAASAFLDACFSNVPGTWLERLALNHACAALKVALYLLQQQEPDGRYLTVAGETGR